MLVWCLLGHRTKTSMDAPQRLSQDATFPRDRFGDNLGACTARFFERTVWGAS